MSFNIQLHTEVTEVQTLQSTSLGIMKWGYSNSFPQTLKNLIEQSANAKPAVSRTAKFYKGAGFEGEDEIVNNYGMTLKNVVSILADDYSVFRAFAIHCNFNGLGQVTEIIPLRIAELRFNEFDEFNLASQIGYHPDFGLNSVVRKTVQTPVTKDKIKWFYRFNPSAVKAQAARAGGIKDYLGQVLYYSDEGHSSYPIPPLQAPINFLLSDIENSILVRKETATGFINSYILKTTLDSEDDTLADVEDALVSAQGARGSGKIITFPNLSPEEVNGTVLEEIGSGTSAKAIIDSAVTTYELNQKVINAAYLIPPILAGADQKNGFSGVNLKDAYFIFNAVTQEGRDTIASEINRILKISVFSVKEIEIKKLDLEEEVAKGNEDAEMSSNTTSLFKDLTGKQMQALQRISRKYLKDELTFEQAKLALLDFGLTEEQVDVWLQKTDD